MDVHAASALLRGWDNILILTHKRPDGDTVGSAAALCALLRQLGKTAWVFPNEDATALMAPYLEGYVAPPDFAYDKVVSVDVATVNLLTPAARAIYDARGIDLVIDHHPSNESFGRENCVEADKAACGEILYKFVLELGTLTPQIATPLYLAVSTDTGCFAYSNTNANTHAVAAELMKLPIPFGEMNKRHFRTKSFRRLQLEAALLANMDLLEEGRVAISALSLEDMARVGAAEEDAEDIAAFLGQIEGVLTSATIRELREGECKISLRSNPDYVDACAVCALLGGGGHRAAAGCTVYGAVSDARSAMKDAIWQVLHGA